MQKVGQVVSNKGKSHPTVITDKNGPWNILSSTIRRIPFQYHKI